MVDHHNHRSGQDCWLGDLVWIVVMGGLAFALYELIKIHAGS